MGAGYFQYIQDFNMSIYNRWGERIYENNSPYEAWNGRKFNSVYNKADADYLLAADRLNRLVKVISPCVTLNS
jgi:hypothetical protein